MTWPPVRMAMSSSMALRRSPKPGALTAAIFRPPRSLLTTSVARASPSTSSEMMRSGLRGLNDGFENRQHGLQVGELLLVQEDVGVFELGNHLVGVGDEVGREVAAVELHAFDDFEFGLGGLGFLDGDDAFVADLLHRLGDHLADRLVAIGGDRADLGDFFGGLDLLGGLAESRDDFGDGEVDAALQVHRVHAGGNGLVAFLDDRLGQNGRGRGAVAGDVVGLRSDFADHLGAHVLELVFKLDFLGDGDAVLGDARCAERLVDDDVAALGAERDLHGVGEDVDAAQHALAGVAGEFYFFGSHLLAPGLRARIG